MMWKELFGDFTGIFDDMRPGPRLRMITVAKPYCSPARDIVMTALQPYGVKVYRYNEVIKTVSPIAAIRSLRVSNSALEEVSRAMDPLPRAHVAEITVSEAAAGWAEYLLLRTGKLYVPGRYVNKRNADWAARHGGQMPPAWHEGKPWIETSCKAGMDAWKPLRDAAKKTKQENKR